MSNLLLNLAAGQWVAKIANTDITYPFAGGRDSEVAVRQFCAAMDEGAEAVLAGICEVFVVPQNISEAKVFEQTLGATDGVVLNGRPIYTAVDSVLADDLEAVGRAILEFLP